MRKAKEIIGLPVLTFTTGRHVAKVHDILFDPAQNRILALLTDEGGWFASAKVIPAERIKSIGPDAVIIEDERAIVSASSNRQIHQALDQDKVITHTRVFTEDGQDIGSIRDMVVDETTGEVLGYEVTGGLISETLRGKKFMPAPATMSMGRDVTFVPTEVGQHMEEEVRGGIQKGLTEAQKGAAGAAGKAQEAAGRAAGQAKEAGSQLTTQAKEAAGNAADQAKVFSEQVRRDIEQRTSETLQTSSEQQRRYLIGKRATSTIRTKDGRVIVRDGDKIGKSDVEAAEDAGVMPQLIASAATGEVQQSGGQLQQGAGNAWDDLRHTVSDYSRGVQQSNQEQRIKNALGRPTTRVILDQNDKVILNTGEIITHESIRLARDAGVLDILLTSAAHGDFTITNEQRKAPESGEASLDYEHRHEHKKK